MELCTARHVCFSPSGSQLALESADKTIIKIWSLSTGACDRTLIGYTSTVYSVYFSPSGSQFTSGSADQTIKIWGP